MSNDPKDPSKVDDQQGKNEDGELSPEDLKKIAGGRSLNYVYNAGRIDLKAETPGGTATIDSGAIRKK